MTNTASLRTKAGRRASLLAGVLVCALLATGADAQAATRPTTESAGLNDPSTYGIDWDDVPTEPTKTVVKVTAENCLCDLTEGTCDANCCCDPDCDSNEKAQFTECATCVYDGANAAMNGKVCLPEGRSPPSLEYCLPSSTVSRVNLLSSSSLGVVTQQKADMSFLSQQLCIKDDNSASLGKYFLDPGFATDDILKSSVTLQSERFRIWGNIARKQVCAPRSHVQRRVRMDQRDWVQYATSRVRCFGRCHLPGAH
jgi:tectonic-1/3